MTARPGGPGRLRLTFAAADGQIPPFPRRRTPSAFHWSQFGRLHSDRALLQSVICAFLMGLVKTPCFATFPSLHAGEFIGFTVFIDAIINCAQEPISATPLLSPNGDP